MKTNYTEVEKQIIKKNVMYKSAIDEYHQIENKYSSISQLLENYTDYPNNDILIVLYYKTMCCAFKQCQKISDYKNLDDIISTVTCRLAEDVMKANLSKHCSQKVLSYVITVMKSYVPKEDTESIYNYEEELSSDDIMDTITTNILAERVKKYVDSSMDIRRKQIFDMVHTDNMSYKEISKEFHVTPDRISQIYNGIIKKIRRKFAINPEFTTNNHKSKNNNSASFSKPENTKTPYTLFVDGMMLSRYLDMMDKPHCVSSEWITNDYSGNNNGIWDSIILGRFNMIDFRSSNIDILYKIYSENLNICAGFNMFMNNYYKYQTNLFVHLSENEQTSIKANIFHAYYSALEFAIQVGRVYDAYEFYWGLVSHYPIDQWFVVDDRYKWSLVDYLAEDIRTYGDKIRRIASNCNYDKKYKLVNYLNKFDFFHKYNKFAAIRPINDINNPIERFNNHSEDISYITSCSDAIKTLSEGYNKDGVRLRASAREALANFCVDNYIIDNNMAIYFLRR